MMEYLTRWSQVQRAGGTDDAARVALDWLFRTYAPVLQARIRPLFPHEVEDVLQDFWLSLWERRGLASADATRGRFRTWLLTCLDHHLLDRQRATSAAKRGGDLQFAGLPAQDLFEDPQPEDPSQHLDALWATTLMERARQRLRDAAGPEGLPRVVALEPYLSTPGNAAAYAATGTLLGLGEGAVKVAIHRLRTAFIAALRHEVADTLTDPTPATIDAELADLHAAWTGARRA